MMKRWRDTGGRYRVREGDGGLEAGVDEDRGNVEVVVDTKDDRRCDIRDKLGSVLSLSRGHFVRDREGRDRECASILGGVGGGISPSPSSGCVLWGMYVCVCVLSVYLQECWRWVCDIFGIYRIGSRTVRQGVLAQGLVYDSFFWAWLTQTRGDSCWTSLALSRKPGPPQRSLARSASSPARRPLCRFTLPSKSE